MKRVITCLTMLLLSSALLTGDNREDKVIVKKNSLKRDGKSYSIQLRQGQLGDKLELYFDDYYDSILDTAEVVAFNNRSKYVDRLAYFGMTSTISDADHDRFWGLLYREIYYRNFDRVDSLVDYFSQSANKNGWNRDRLLNEVVSFVQRIEYLIPDDYDIDRRSPVNNIGIFSPNQVLFYEKGDCDSKSLLLVLLLKRLGYDAVILVSRAYKHAVVAINYPGVKGRYKVSNNRRYYTIEATAVTRIGYLSNKYSDMSKWAIIRID